MKELNFKLNNWAGTMDVEYTHSTYGIAYCFGWLVPEALKLLIEKGYIPPIMKLFQLWYDELVSLTGGSSNVEQAALTLCIALEKRVDSRGASVGA